MPANEWADESSTVADDRTIRPSGFDPQSPRYKWVDEGMVLRSEQEKDDWNALDPNLFVEDKRNVWLNWGSFWGGTRGSSIAAP